MHQNPKQEWLDGMENVQSALAQLNSAHTLEVNALQRENTRLKVQVGQLRSSLKQLHSSTLLEANSPLAAWTSSRPSIVRSVCSDDDGLGSIAEDPEHNLPPELPQVQKMFQGRDEDFAPTLTSSSVGTNSSAQACRADAIVQNCGSERSRIQVRDTRKQLQPEPSVQKGMRARVGTSGSSMTSSRSLDVPLSHDAAQSSGHHAPQEVRDFIKAMQRKSEMSESLPLRGTKLLKYTYFLRRSVEIPEDHGRGTSWYRSLHCIVESPWFDSICALMIILNSLLIGASVEYKATGGSEEEEHWTEVAGHVCSGFFLIELLMRVSVEGRNYFCSESRNWNVFDVFLVVFSIVDFTLNASSPRASSSTGITSSMKIMKMLRIARVFRVFRFFRELSLLALMIVDSIRSLVWALIMLTLIIYVFAICFTQFATEYINEHGTELNPEIERRFGTLLRTVYSLVLAMLNGISWHVLSDALLTIHWGAAAFFFFYITFTILAVLNIITGVFVDNAVETAGTQREFLVQKEMEIKEKYVKEMREFFRQMDQDESGTVSLEEVKDHFEDARVRSYFQALGIDPQDTERLFHLIDTDGSGEIEVDEFLDGCLRLKGSARSIDVHAVMYECKRLEHRQVEMLEFLRQDKPGTLFRWSTKGSNIGGTRTLSSRLLPAEDAAAWPERDVLLGGGAGADKLHRKRADRLGEKQHPEEGALLDSAPRERDPPPEAGETTWEEKALGISPREIQLAPWQQQAGAALDHTSAATTSSASTFAALRGTDCALTNGPGDSSGSGPRSGTEQYAESREAPHDKDVDYFSF